MQHSDIGKLVSLLILAAGAMACAAAPGQARAQARPAPAGKKGDKKVPKIILLAGAKSHGKGIHDHPGGLAVLKQSLEEAYGDAQVTVELYEKGWPDDPAAMNGASTIVVFSDGWDKHCLAKPERLAAVRKLMAGGTGLICLHFAVAPPKGTEAEFLTWLGGYYEDGYSKNPVNTVETSPASPNHPICRGWKAFTAKDEYYYQIRFGGDDKRVAPIMTAMLPKDKPKKETIAWAVQRKNGGRGFGFTGGHFHANWKIKPFRTMVLNAIVWTAGMEVPPNGVPSTYGQQ
ncbi:MAG: ThuA domain-containing protein [Phycisphaerae bacterium]|nr:ThuA domain-containing protein [Phycisphaerae bacterium]